MFVMMSYSFSLCDNNKFKFINKSSSPTCICMHCVLRVIRLR